MLAAVAEMLGHRGRVGRALHAQQRRRIGRRGDDHAAAQAFLAQDVLDEFLHFAAALADQADDDDVRLRVAGHHAQQHRLADAGAGEQAQALAAAHGQQRIDRAHAGVQRAADRVAVHRVDGAAHHRFVAHVHQRAAAVQRMALRVDDAPQQAVAHGQVQTAVLVAAPGMALLAEHRPVQRGGPRQHHRAAGQALDLVGGHQVGAVAGETDHLGRDRALAAARRGGGGGHVDLAHRAHRHFHAGGLQHQAGHAHQLALRLQRRRVAGEGLQVVEILGPAVGAAAHGSRSPLFW